MSRLQHLVTRPELVRVAGDLRLVVDGDPYLVLGGELHNSSASSARAIDGATAAAAALNVNTVLAPVSWDLFEPREGEHDTALVDALLASARAHGLRLILLWFGAWKNGRSTYMPPWVRSDPLRFPRAELQSRDHCEHLSPFAPSVREAEGRTFASLMRHLREVDEDHATVLMVQVENEVGLLGDSRDRSALAEQHFTCPVPAGVVEAVQTQPDLRISAAWRARGRPGHGTWAEMFGASPETDEAFMAAAYADHVEHVAAAGRAEYALPLFTNAWLYTQTEVADGTPAGGQRPGVYPSGGPLPHVAGIWRTLAPTLDLLVPDVYFGDFEQICRDYRSIDGGLFIPEMRRDEHGVGDAFVALGTHGALGVSPFGIDTLTGPEAEPLTDAYGLLAAIAHRVVHQPTVGVHLHDDHPEQVITLDEFVITARREPNGDAGSVARGYGLIVSLTPDQFLVAGRGLHLSFGTPDGQQAELVSVEELDDAQDGGVGRRLNGDETLGGTVVILHALAEPAPSETYRIPTWRRGRGLLRVTVAGPPRGRG